MEQEPPIWNRTINERSRLQLDPRFEESGMPDGRDVFAGRAVIHRDTPINRGVYLGAGSREAIVVDDSPRLGDAKEVYNEAYRDFMDAYRKRTRGVSFWRNKPKEAARAAYSIALKHLGEGDTSAKVAELITNWSHGKPEAKIEGLLL